MPTLSHHCPLFVSLRAVAPLLAIACATGSGGSSRSALLLSDAPPPRAGCHVEANPSPIPALSTIADSAGLTSTLTRFARQSGTMADDSDYVILSVRYDARRVVQKVFPIRGWLPDGTDGAIADVVQAHLTSGPASTESLRLRVSLSRPVMIRVGRSERCEPTTGTRIRIISRVMDPVSAPVPPLLHVLVHESGKAESVAIIRSSGNDDLDRIAMEAVARSHHSPGLIDGRPADMEFDETVQIRSSVRSGSTP